MMDLAKRLALGVLDALEADVSQSELRFRFYVLYAAAQKLTWLDHTGKRALAPEERELCNVVEDAYRELEFDAN
jgi:hypothetical protein